MHIPVFSGLRVVDFNPGINLELSNQTWRFSCPEGSRQDVRFTVRGAQALDADNGCITVHTRAGTVRIQSALVNGDVPRQSSISCEENTVCIHAADRASGLLELSLAGNDRAKRQQRIYSTYIGSPADDNPVDFAVDSAGNFLFIGYTDLHSLPVCDGSTLFIGSYNTDFDCWLGKLSPDLSILYWQTYLAGSETDLPDRMTVDTEGSLVAIITTVSADLPLIQGYDLTFNGLWDQFLFKLNPQGDELLFTTYFGGSSADSYAQGLALAANNDVIFSFTSFSVDIPAPNGFCPDNQGGRDNYIGGCPRMVWSCWPVPTWVPTVIMIRAVGWL